MNFVDWRIFYEAAKASDPYSVAGYFNPIQVAWALKITTFLPFTAWAFMMVALSMLAVLLVCKKNTHWVWLSAPFVCSMTWGSLDTLLLTPAFLFGGVGLSLITMKPQIAIILIPFKLAEWWRGGKVYEIRRFFIATALLWGVPTLVQPSWITNWLHAMPSLTEKSGRAASLASWGSGEVWVVAMFAIMLVVMLWLILKGNNNFYLPMIFSPVVAPSYHLISMQSIGWQYCLFSWVLTLAGIWLNGPRLFFLLPLFVLWGQSGYSLDAVKRLLPRPVFAHSGKVNL